MGEWIKLEDQQVNELEDKNWELNLLSADDEALYFEGYNHQKKKVIVMDRFSAKEDNGVFFKFKV